MKTYISPEMSVLSLSAQDIMRTSGNSVGDIGGASVIKDWDDLESGI